MWEEIISGLEDFRILKEEASEKGKPADTLILDFEPQELFKKINFSFLSPSAYVFCCGSPSKLIN